MYGAKESRKPHPLFCPETYLASQSGNSIANPLLHYLQQHPARQSDRPHLLFDTGYYLAQHPDLSEAGGVPLIHYLKIGEQKGFTPHVLFDPTYYLQHNQDVAAAGIRALLHFVRLGGVEGRSPHPAFDCRFYQRLNSDVLEAKINPLVHYLAFGAREERDPHPLFSTAYYLRTYPDIRAANINPLEHYVQGGGYEGRNPHPFFDSRYYLETNPDVRAAGLNPLVHFLNSGSAEGRRPGPFFDPAYFQRQYPDAGGSNPLVHYLAVADRTKYPPNESLGIVERHYTPPNDLLPWFNPLNIRVDGRLSEVPHLNILVPGLAMKHMSGGPNTAINIGYRLAQRSVPVRFIATNAPLDADHAPFWAHAGKLADIEGRISNAVLVDASDRSRPLFIGDQDIFLATAWWTAQMVKYALPWTRYDRFIYLIQDFEPVLHAASTPCALAMDTYSLDYFPVINSSLLRDHLVENRVGAFDDPIFAAAAHHFEPSVDPYYFRVEVKAGGRRRLQFYTRPVNGLRNLYEMGVAALQLAVSRGCFDSQSWEIIGIGEQFAPVPLGRGLTLVPAPWHDFATYAANMRSTDIMLSLMMAPHPSYPPLEAAACGAMVVTTNFGSKTTRRMQELSTNILSVEPTIEGLADALAEAVSRLDAADARRGGAAMGLPTSWGTALAGTLDAIEAEIGNIRASRLRRLRRLETVVDQPVHSSYDLARLTRLAERRDLYPALHEPSLLSFITTVWNTDPDFMHVLAESVFAQDMLPDGLEWLILDNGSTNEATRRILAEISRHPMVRLIRVEENQGIIGGMRIVLEQARGRYILPLDSDDYIYPDCVRTITWFIRKNDYPALLYTDEDKLLDDKFCDPYHKTSWDPVLFVNQCFIAHQCVIDRRLALKLGVYSDVAAEGSHDWDTFTRFMIAGYQPMHVPEVLYSWRMHQNSTSMNIGAKPVVYDSQKAVLQRFLDSKDANRFTLASSGLFRSTPDWRIVRKGPSKLAERLATLLLTDDGDQDNQPLPRLVQRRHGWVVTASAWGGTASLARSLAMLPADVTHLHVRDGRIQPLDELFLDEAETFFELFADTVAVGGRIDDGTRVLSAGILLGFDGAWGVPDRGRYLADPGYFVQLFKSHSVSAISLRHAIVQRDFLEKAVVAAGQVSLETLEAWIGGLAFEQGRRIIYTPFIVATTQAVGWPIGASETERQLFRARFAALLPDTRFYARRHGLTHSTRYLDIPAAQRQQQEVALRASVGKPYPQWLSDRIDRRRDQYQAADGDVSFSVLTTVYEKTDIALFIKLADSILAQDFPAREWIVLAHGPIPGVLSNLLQRMAERSELALILREANLGITGGMRLCLEAARGDYVIPVDADDLLTVDALRVLAATIRTHAYPGLVYSDEDILIGDQPRTPYFRPSWDPVLNLEGSFIWHLCAIKRSTAARCRLYADEGATWCHDWDSATKIQLGGEAVVHVPEVLYHWRQHEVSSTNSVSSPHQGSLQSVQWVLENLIRQSPKSHYLRVREFPIMRGARETHLERIPTALPPVSDVLFCQRRRILRNTGTVHVLLTAGPLQLQELRSVVQHLDHEYVILRTGDTSRSWTDGMVAEAVKYSELVPDVAMVTGRFIDKAGIVVAGAEILTSDLRIISPLAGLAKDAAGPFSLALRPHCVNVPNLGNCLIDRRFLLEAIDVAPFNLTLPYLSLWMAAVAQARGRLVVYSPLVSAPAEQAQAGVLQDAEETRRFWSFACAQLKIEPVAPLRGLAGFQSYMAFDTD